MSGTRSTGVLAALALLAACAVAGIAPATAATTTIAADSFSRTVAAGLGTADVGGAWSLAGGSARFSVGGGTARLSLPAAVQVSAYLPATAVGDTDVVATLGVAALPQGGSSYLSLVARHTASTDYSAEAVVAPSGGVALKLLSGTRGLVSVPVPGLAVAAGSGVRVRLETVGVHPTTVRARAWKPGTAEPSTWQVTATDDTAALQAPGAIGIRSYLGSGTTNGPLVSTVDDLAATTPAPANAAPTAGFTATPSGQTVAFDGRASTDPDGAIASWTWTYGDGTSGTGATTSHVYAAPGTYPVTLVVADGQGASGTAQQQVAVLASNRPPVPTLLEQSDALTATFWGDRSTDPDGTVAGYRWSFGDGATATGSVTTHRYATPGTYTVTLTVTDDRGAGTALDRAVSVYGSGTRPTQAQWLTDVDAAIAGGTAYLDAHAAVPAPAVVLDVDNTALQSYYGSFAATPAVLALERRAVADGYTVLVATGRAADSGGTRSQLTNAGYRVDALCFRDPAAPSVQASKAACRAAWAAQGFTIVADVGNHTTDLDGGNSGQAYLLPNYAFLD
jgi:PKD repeat protein